VNSKESIYKASKIIDFVTTITPPAKLKSRIQSVLSISLLLESLMISKCSNLLRNPIVFNLYEECNLNRSIIKQFYRLSIKND